MRTRAARWQKEETFSKKKMVKMKSHLERISPRNSESAVGEGNFSPVVGLSDLSLSTISGAEFPKRRPRKGLKRVSSESSGQSKARQR